MADQSADALANPPVAPQPPVKDVPSWYDGLRVRVAPALGVAAAVTGIGTGLKVATNLGNEVKQIATDPDKRREFLHSTLVGMASGTDEPMGGEAGTLYDGLRVRKVAPDPAVLAKDAGLVYKGELVKGSDVHMFEHPDHPGKTMAANGSELSTPDALKTRMDAKVEQFNAKAPQYAYRARPVGQTGIPSDSPAQATASELEAHQYATNLVESTGKPHEVVRVDLNKIPADKFTRHGGPNRNDWVKFHEPVDEKNVEPVSKASVPPEQTTGIHDAAIKKGGAIPGGIQKGDPEYGDPDLALFHDPQTGSTLALKTTDVTPENIAKELQNSRAKYSKGSEVAKEDWDHPVEPTTAQTLADNTKVWTEPPSTNKIITAAEKSLTERGFPKENLGKLRQRAMDEVGTGHQFSQHYAEVLKDAIRAHDSKMASKSVPIPTKIHQNAMVADNMNDPATRLVAARHEAAHAVISEALNPGSVNGTGLTSAGGVTDIQPPAGKTTVGQLTPDEIRDMVATSYAGGLSEPGGTTIKHASGDVAARAQVLAGRGTSEFLQAPELQATARARVNALLADPAIQNRIDTLAGHISAKGKLSGDDVREILKTK